MLLSLSNSVDEQLPLETTEVFWYPWLCRSSQSILALTSYNTIGRRSAWTGISRSHVLQSTPSSSFSQPIDEPYISIQVSCRYDHDGSDQCWVQTVRDDFWSLLTIQPGRVSTTPSRTFISLVRFQSSGSSMMFWRSGSSNGGIPPAVSDLFVQRRFTTFFHTALEVASTL